MKPADVRRGLRMAALGFGVSTAVALALAVPSYLSMSANARFWTALRGALPTWWAWGLLTPAVWWVDGRFAERLPGWRRFAAHLPMAVIFTAAFVLLRAVLERAFWETGADRLARLAGGAGRLVPADLWPHRRGASGAWVPRRGAGARAAERSTGREPHEGAAGGS